MRARDNPFRTERLLAIRYRFEDFTREELLRRLARQGYRGAIVGPEGSGKTTLLENLAAALEAAGLRVRLVRAGPGVQLPAVAGEILFVDSAERVTFAAWLLFRWRTRNAAGLVITARRPGRLRTLARLATTPSLLAAIASDLLDAPFPIAAAERLHKRYSGNLRAALLHLYDERRAETPAVLRDRRSHDE
jgi:hypothetical protein